MPLPKLRPDLAQHAVYGNALFLAGWSAGRLLQLPAPTCGMGAVVVVAVIKEAVDRVKGTGTADPLDALVTALAALPAYIAGTYPE